DSGIKNRGILENFLILCSLLETAADVEEKCSFKLKRVMESDSALTEDLIAYNIIPLDAASSTNAIVSFPEVSGILCDSKSRLICFSGILLLYSVLLRHASFCVIFQVAIVVGGRNFFCGDAWVAATGLERCTAYQVG
ncbi:hypothetical protein S245_045039, partial [Arachis hypogaea]